MNEDIKNYHETLSGERREIVDLLFMTITEHLHYTENKVWHGHPVWFIKGNPIVGYSSLKSGIQLMFWSGASFDVDNLKPGTGKFKDASATYSSIEDVHVEDIKTWLALSEKIQWDYKNIIKRKGELVRLK